MVGVEVWPRPCRHCRVRCGERIPHGHSLHQRELGKAAADQESAGMFGIKECKSHPRQGEQIFEEHDLRLWRAQYAICLHRQKGWFSIENPVQSWLGFSQRYTIWTHQGVIHTLVTFRVLHAMVQVDRHPFTNCRWDIQWPLGSQKTGYSTMEQDFRFHGEIVG